MPYQKSNKMPVSLFFLKGTKMLKSQRKTWYETNGAQLAHALCIAYTLIWEKKGVLQIKMEI